jgi:hypothetical protein
MSVVEEPEVSGAVRAAFEPILKALDPVRQALAGHPDVVSIRPGYDYPPSGAPVPAVVVAVTPGTAPVKNDELTQQFSVPFCVTDASVEEQVAAFRAEEGAVPFSAPGAHLSSPLEVLLTGEEPLDFAPPRTGAYRPLEPPNLPLVDEDMKLTICVSPEAGWGELRAFLADTRDRLAVAMYQFTAPHILEAVRRAMEPAGRRLELVLHPRPERPPKSGIKAYDLDEESQVIAPLREAMGDRFTMSWATLSSRANPEGLWASAYHIKVAVRDGKALWLSSGNWQSSNQPDVDPFADEPEDVPPGFPRRYNREYHAIIENEALASAFEAYIKRDRELTSGEREPEASELPDLFVPEEEEEPVDFAVPRLFPPLRLERRVKVHPLLTPDNYAEAALGLIRSARRSVWFQNQYINFRDSGEDFPEFKQLVGALKQQIDNGLDVRIICRNNMKRESVDVLVALGFPRDVMRFQPACHNKTIIVDGEVVLFGSHNWSNEGVRTNRDASLIFYDEEVAAYLAEVYEHDWDRLARPRAAPPPVRVAREGAQPPDGFRRASFAEVFED